MTTIEHIEKLEKELAELKAELNKPKKFEFKWEKAINYHLDATYVSGGYSAKWTEDLKHGRYRRTYEGAELSLRRNKRANHLEMLVEYLGGLKEFDKKDLNYCIYQNKSSGKWYYIDTSYYQPEVIYITAEVVEKVVEILNNKEYEL